MRNYKHPFLFDGCLNYRHVKGKRVEKHVINVVLNVCCLTYVQIQSSFKLVKREKRALQNAYAFNRTTLFSVTLSDRNYPKLPHFRYFYRLSHLGCWWQ